MSAAIGRAEGATPEESGEAFAAGVVGALDALRVALTVFGPEGRLTYANAHLPYLFPELRDVDPQGLSLEDLLIRLAQLGALAMPPTRAVAMAADLAERCRADERAPVEFQVADGRVIEIKLRSSPSGRVALWSDVTHARHAMIRLEDAIELSADAFAFWDQAGRLQLANAAFLELYALPADAAERRMTRADVAAQVEAAELFADSETGFRELQPISAVETVHVSGRAFLICERRARDGGRVTVLSDISDRKRVEAMLAERERSLAETREELHESRSLVEQQQTFLADLAERAGRAEAEAEQAGAAKTAFIRTMSHELRTPLNAIIGFSDVLKSMGSSAGAERVAEYVGLIHDSGRTLLKLLNQVIDLTKVAAGNYPVRCEETALSTVVLGAAEQIEGPAAARGITLALPAADVLGETAVLDEAVIRAALGHVLDNALRYAASRIAIEAHADGERITLIVRDDGPGIAEDEMDRALKPFEHGCARSASAQDGAGLGLSMAQALLETHGGILALAQGEGGGLEVRLGLPRRPAA